MKVIGLTGGSGAGKSRIAKELENYGASIIDCDLVYRGLFDACAQMRREISTRFPESVKNQEISRRILAGIVFSDRGALDDLNKITHKYVLEQVSRRLTEERSAGRELCVIEAIALFESGADVYCDIAAGVTAGRGIRIERIMERDGIDQMAAAARIDAQRDDEFYRERCDILIINNGNERDIKTGVCRIIETLRERTDSI